MNERFACTSDPKNGRGRRTTTTRRIGEDAKQIPGGD
jgi:hypothetical protein